MIEKDTLINALGKSRVSIEINDLESKLSGHLEADDFSLEDEEYLLAFSDGLSLTFIEGYLSSIHLYLDDNGDGYSPYVGWFSDVVSSKFISLNDFIKKSGNPSSQGGGTEFMGKVDQNWIRYDSDEYYLHYTFSEDNSQVNLVTLGIKK